MKILAIDPGLSTGWALLDAGILIDCGLGDPRSQSFCNLARVLIERPRVYPGPREADPNDLITLAIMVGRYSEAFEAKGFPVEHIFPRVWKGTVNADVLCNRVLDSLPQFERQLYESKVSKVAEGKRHNVIDAIGIGKWSLRRARPGVF